jgi:hypothetical protein
MVETSVSFNYQTERMKHPDGSRNSSLYHAKTFGTVCHNPVLRQLFSYLQKLEYFQVVKNT